MAGEYNGVIGRIETLLKEYGRRLNCLEKQYDEDHDELVAIRAEVENMTKVIEQHLKYHEKLAMQALSFKQGVVLISLQILANIIIAYLMYIK